MDILLSEQFEYSYKKLGNREKMCVRQAISLLFNDIINTLNNTITYDNIKMTKSSEITDVWVAELLSRNLFITFEVNGNTTILHNVSFLRNLFCEIFKEYKSEIFGIIILGFYTYLSTRCSNLIFDFSWEELFTIFIGAMLIYPLNQINLQYFYKERRISARCYQHIRNKLVTFYEYSPAWILFSILLRSIFENKNLPIYYIDYANLSVIWGIAFLLLFAVLSPKKIT